jgi:acyl-homoserine-lactone acylase
LADPIGELRRWDRRSSVSSVATSAAVFWGTEFARRVRSEMEPEDRDLEAQMVSKAKPRTRLEALAAAVDTLTARFGNWRTPWGEINRFQRLTGDIVHPFSDQGASVPVGFAGGEWGSLAAFGARSHNGTKRIYGTSGNSFVAVVEFGDSVRARAVTAGGASGDPESPHFNDQAVRYSTGDLRPVYFYPSQLAGHTERQYRPGQPITSR